MTSFLRDTAADLLHLFFPHICAGCGSDMVAEKQLICISCLEQLPQTRFHFHAANPVEKIFWGRIALSSAASYYFFTKDSILQKILHQLKYKNRDELGYYLGKLMGEGFLQSSRFNRFDAIVPLPLSPSKQKLRGYNQAEMIADGIGEVMNIPVLNKSVIRIKNTETQTFKSRIERWENIQGTFLVSNPESITGKHILLIDDVVTTGATLEACGSAILNQDNTSLSIATVAYTSL